MAVLFTNLLIVLAITIGLPLVLQLILEIYCITAVFLDKKIKPHERIAVINKGLNKTYWLGFYTTAILFSVIVNLVHAFKAPYYLTTDTIVSMVSVSALLFVINYMAILLAHAKWFADYKARNKIKRELREQSKVGEPQ